MLGFLSVFLLLLAQGPSAEARVENPSLDGSTTSFRSISELEDYIAKVQEYRQLTHPKFRDISESIRGKGEIYDIEAMKAQLDASEYHALNLHYSALHRTRRVRRFVAYQRRMERRNLAAQKRQESGQGALASTSLDGAHPSALKPFIDPTIPSDSSSNNLEQAHNQLALSYPDDLFADKIEHSAAHPMGIESSNPSGQLGGAVHPPIRSYVEAFDSYHNPVLDGASEMFSHEPDETGWFISTAYEHLPTLEWIGNSHRDIETPLISENAIWGLNRLMGTSFHADAGMIFGKVASGWKVEFVGQSDAVLYLDSDLRAVSPSDTRLDRYFVLMNAQPGTHFAYLSSDSSSDSGAVVFPVIHGVATYLDLTEVSYSRFAGKVVLTGSELEEEDDRLVSRATVRIIGQKVGGMTNDRGRFRFDRVMVISDYPLFAETDHADSYSEDHSDELAIGYTHRYRILPKNLKRATLYRIPSEEIDDWRSQIPGGVKAGNGMILTALPNLVANEPELSLEPSVRLVKSANLQTFSQTYTMTPTGVLHPDEPLQEGESRFLAEAPDQAAVLVQASSNRDPRRPARWSEVTHVSSDVINVIGPN